VKIHKFILEIILTIILVILVILLVCKETAAPKQSLKNNFTTPEIEKAEPARDYILTLKFLNPKLLQNKKFSGKVITSSGEQTMGEFTVRDIRLWRLDGTRIINDQFKFKDQPLYISINDISLPEQKIIYEGDIGEMVTLEPKERNSSKLTISLSKPTQEAQEY